MKRTIIALFSLFYFSSCFLHHVNIDGDVYGAKTIFRTSDRSLSTLPIRLEFKPQSPEEAIVYLRAKGTGVTVKPEDIAGYSSPEIISQFQRSSKFVMNPDANMKVKIRSSVEEVKNPVITLIAGVFTFGVFPFVYRTYGTIYFELSDMETSKIVKVYKYPIEHRSFMGWAPIILGPILGIFSDRFDHSISQKNFAIMKVAFSQFEFDIQNDLNSSPEIAARFFVTKKRHYALLLADKVLYDSEKIAALLHMKLQKSFLENGLSMVERKRLDGIVSEIQLSLSGITENTRLKLGQLLEADRLILVEDLDYKTKQPSSESLSFSIRCLDVLTGKILWTEKLEASSGSAEGMIQKTISTLIERLKGNGDI